MTMRWQYVFKKLSCYNDIWRWYDKYGRLLDRSNWFLYAVIYLFEILEDQPAFGRLTSSSCGGLWDRRDPDTSDVSPRACGARLGRRASSHFPLPFLPPCHLFPLSPFFSRFLLLFLTLFPPFPAFSYLFLRPKSVWKQKSVAKILKFFENF